MTELNPDQTLRRSPLYRRHVQLDAQFEPLGDALVVGAYSDTGMEPRLGVSLGLADLCCLPRTGFKGHGAPDWAAAQGVDLPSVPNTAQAQADGSVVAKLSHQELLIISGLQGNSDLVDRLNQQAFKFEKQSKRLKNVMWWKKVKMYLMFTFLAAVIIFAISAMACGGIDFHGCKSDKRRLL